jgi:hypothetical protein
MCRPKGKLRAIVHGYLPGIAEGKPPSGYGVGESPGDAMVTGDCAWLRYHGCRHVAVIQAEVLAWLVGYDSGGASNAACAVQGDESGRRRCVRRQVEVS